MAETVNTTHMAEKLCDELFSEFLWLKVGPANENWACTMPAVHKTKQGTHPSDVVYFYDEPYAQRRTYVQCDLKSYAKGTITSKKVKDAVLSLVNQVQCAEKSEQWRELYAHPHVSSYSVTGLLVVYNHDGEYEASFDDHLRLIRTEEFDIPRDSKVVVIGPREVFLLDNIRYEIRQMRGTAGADSLPPAEDCQYFFPQLASRANLQMDAARAANLEMLTSPWVVLTYQNAKMGRGVVIFYKRRGQTPDEFMYLIDYLRQHDLLDDSISVRIRAIDAVATAPANFQKAQHRYIEEMGDPTETTDLSVCVNAIRFSLIEQVRSTFSTVQIGMGDEN